MAQQGNPEALKLLTKDFVEVFERAVEKTQDATKLKELLDLELSVFDLDSKLDTERLATELAAKKLDFTESFFNSLFRPF